MKNGKVLACLLALAMLCGLFAACGTKQQETQTPSQDAGQTAPTETQEQPQEAEKPEQETVYTGEDDPRNADGIGSQELLVVSFGTSYNDSRVKTIGAIEKAMEEAFPDWSVRRAFTSQIIIDKLRERDGEVIDNVKEALDRAVDNGVKKLVVQPTHLMNGIEYEELTKTLAEYSDAFEQVAVGAPLLTDELDFERVGAALVIALGQYDDGNTAMCFMGHGTEAESNSVYEQMQQQMFTSGCHNYFIGTVEAEPSVEDVLAQVQSGEYSRVILHPLMIVAGDHANNDMAGDEEDSWKSVFEAAGYEVECVLEGLGEMQMVRDLFVEHVRTAMESVA